MTDDAKQREVVYVFLCKNVQPDKPPPHVAALFRALKKTHPGLEMRPIQPPVQTDGAVKPDAFIVYSDFWGWGFWA